MSPCGDLWGGRLLRHVHASPGWRPGRTQAPPTPTVPPTPAGRLGSPTPQPPSGFFFLGRVDGPAGGARGGGGGGGWARGGGGGGPGGAVRPRRDPRARPPGGRHKKKRPAGVAPGGPSSGP